MAAATMMATEAGVARKPTEMTQFASQTTSSTVDDNPTIDDFETDFRTGEPIGTICEHGDNNNNDSDMEEMDTQDDSDKDDGSDCWSLEKKK